MAIVHLQRERYRPRLPVIHYVVNQRVIARTRPARVRNPRTKAQQANRQKLGVASRFLRQVQAFAVNGFKPGKRSNGRPVGAYHVALGQLLNTGMRREAGEWCIDYARVQLAQGRSLRGYPLRVNRQGRLLKLSWPEGLPEGTRRIRLAVHSARANSSCVLLVNAPRQGGRVELSLPKWAKAGALHLWWCPVGAGKTRWRSGYLSIPQEVGVFVGVLVFRSTGFAPSSVQLAGRAPSRRGDTS